MNNGKFLTGFGLFLLSSAVVFGPVSANAFDVLPAKPPIPSTNPMTKEKIELGKQLFFDTRLSRDGSISCNSCHNVMAGGDDNNPNSAGVAGKRGSRSAPTVWNSAFLSVQFWDGRAKSLEEQAKGPITNPVEMSVQAHDIVTARIRKIPGYVAEFQKVFPKDVKEAKDIKIDHLTLAIAAYERTLITPNSAFDLYLKGNKNAISAEAIRGSQLVQSVGCTSCHSGANYAGPALPEGTGFYQKFPVFPGTEYEKKYSLTTDLGRYEVTKDENDKHTWRVPTWRNIALTAPYFHNGSVKTLEEAVRVMAKTQLNKDLKDEEAKDIVAFLETLTGKFPEQTLPRLPETRGYTIFE